MHLNIKKEGRVAQKDVLELKSRESAESYHSGGEKDGSKEHYDGNPPLSTAADSALIKF